MPKRRNRAQMATASSRKSCSRLAFLAPRGHKECSPLRFFSRHRCVVPQPALNPSLLPFSLLLPGNAGDLLQLEVPLWLTRAPAVYQVIGGPGEQTGGATLHVASSRAVYSAIQNREDDGIHIRILGGADDGSNLDWSGKISDIYTKKGPPRSMAVLEALFEETDSGWMKRMMATMIGLRRTHQLNTPKFGFSLIVWSRLPVLSGFGGDVAMMTSTAMAFKASTGLDKKRVDGIRLARAIVQGAREIMGERIPLGDAITCALAERQTGMFIEHGADPTMQWAPIPDHTFLGAIDLGMDPVTEEEDRRAAAVGAAMGMSHLNKERRKQKEPQYGGWGQVTPKEFEGGLRSFVPARESGADFVAGFAKLEPEVAELVDESRPYRERALSEHQMRESGRVNRFVEQLAEYARTKREDHLSEAGKVLGSSHRSLRDKCSIQDDAIDFVLGEIQKAGRDAGLFGGRLSGAGDGSVIVVLAHQAGEERLREIMATFSEKFTERVVDPPSLHIETGRGAAMTGWWEGVLRPKEEPAPAAAVAGDDKDSK